MASEDEWSPRFRATWKNAVVPIERIRRVSRQTRIHEHTLLLLRSVHGTSHGAAHSCEVRDPKWWRAILPSFHDRALHTADRGIHRPAEGPWDHPADRCADRSS